MIDEDSWWIILDAEFMISDNTSTVPIRKENHTWMVMMSLRENDSSVMRSFQNFALMLSRSTASNA